ncbi:MULTISPECIES: PAS domain S-box protein [Phyllobacterium]|uniref:PAS domain S-box protein n=1 Tax=Phyllobacterium TaxID=28100 RepID=UPI001CBCAE96|nr:PAS domain S-box protein [Phyllobacterium calauticae]MBZ3695523.1 PAS domain S-box protein [Phyllobacterium calauticae]
MNGKDLASNKIEILMENAGNTLPWDSFTPDYLLECLPAAIYVTDASGRITFFNEAAAELWGQRPELGKSEFCGSWKIFWPDGTPLPHAECPMALALKLQRPVRGVEAIAERPDGSRVPFLPFPTPLFDEYGTLTGAINLLVDISSRKQAEETLIRQKQRMETLNRISKVISSDLDLDRIIQTVTEVATDLTGAQFGAFYNAPSEEGESYSPYSLSGIPQETFEKLDLPRNPALFDPIFRDISIIRSNDVRSDPRYGKSTQGMGTSKGHPPLVSYLAVPVISRTGEVHGGLFFGHDRPDIFTPEVETIVAAIAAQAAVAIDNARLLLSARLELSERRNSEQAAQRLAAIVESSDDAILTKTLDGIITSWNRGAEKLFGYTEVEAVGMNVTTLIPEEMVDEEPSILRRLRNGERIDHYETIRKRKDGSFVDISLSVSPLRDATGKVYGASKIARDVTERRKAHERQNLLLREMNHRVKNLFAVASGVVALSGRNASSIESLVASIRERLAALATAHIMTLPNLSDEHLEAPASTSLHQLLEAMLAPYRDLADLTRIEISGDNITIQSSALTGLSLVLHEFATNAAKYGALSTPDGHLRINICDDDNDLSLEWIESGGPAISDPTDHRGFGATLEKAIIESQLCGRIDRSWKPDGVTIHVSIPLSTVEQNS